MVCRSLQQPSTLLLLKLCTAALVQPPWQGLQLERHISWTPSMMPMSRVPCRWCARLEGCASPMRCSPALAGLAATTGALRPRCEPGLETPAVYWPLCCDGPAPNHCTSVHWVSATQHIYAAAGAYLSQRCSSLSSTGIFAHVSHTCARESTAVLRCQLYIYRDLHNEQRCILVSRQCLWLPSQHAAYVYDG